MVTGIYDWNKPGAQHHRKLKLGSKFKCLNIALLNVSSLYIIWSKSKPSKIFCLTTLGKFIIKSSTVGNPYSFFLRQCFITSPSLKVLVALQLLFIVSLCSQNLKRELFFKSSWMQGCKLSIFISLNLLEAILELLEYQRGIMDRIWNAYQKCRIVIKLIHNFEVRLWKCNDVKINSPHFTLFAMSQYRLWEYDVALSILWRRCEFDVVISTLQQRFQ